MEHSYNSHDSIRCTLFINFFRRCCINAECFCFPYLPIVIQGCCIKRPWPSCHNKRETKFLCGCYILKACLHHSDMWQKITRHIKGCKLHSIFIVLNFFKNPCCDSLCRLSGIIPRKHSVDICVIRWSESFSDIHGIGIQTRDD